MYSRISYSVQHHLSLKARTTNHSHEPLKTLTCRSGDDGSTTTLLTQPKLRTTLSPAPLLKNRAMRTRRNSQSSDSEPSAANLQGPDQPRREILHN